MRRCQYLAEPAESTAQSQMGKKCLVVVEAVGTATALVLAWAVAERAHCPLNECPIA